MAKKGGNSKIAKGTKMLLPLMAALLFLGLALDSVGYNMVSSNMATILGLFAFGVLMFEAKDTPKGLGKDGKKYFQMAVFLVGILLLATILPPLFGTVLITGMMATLSLFGGLLVSAVLLFV